MSAENRHMQITL